jgi:hypothetical protein
MIYDVLVAGEINPDLILRGALHRPSARSKSWSTRPR